jgi:ATP-dependent Clp protease protease subunit
MPNILNFKKSTETKLRVFNKSATVAEIVIYAGIGQDFWGDGSMISAKQFSDELKKLDASVEEIIVRVNSPGGDVFDGLAIYNRLVQHKAKVTVYIDGLAASISSIIALAGDEVFIGEGALFMIHLPWTMSMGNRMELDNTVNRLITVEEQMISIYAKKTGMARSEIKSMMETETWMDAAEAISHGFVDSAFEIKIPIAASAIDSRWIVRKPKKYFSETAAVNEVKEALKQKLKVSIARK